MLFFESLRTAAGRYATGVHRLGPPADAAQLISVEARLETAIPACYRELLQSFDGISLFHESYELFPAASLERGGPERRHLRVGDTPEGALYLPLTAAGRLLLVDESSPDPIVAGSHIEPWLEATLAREALLCDCEGEFRDVFTDDDITLPVRRKRAQLGRRHDPQAALYLLEEAELALEEEQPTAALDWLRQAVALDPGAGPAWELLATLLLDEGDSAGAEQAASQAAAATWHEPLREARRVLALRGRTKSSLRVI